MDEPITSTRLGHEIAHALLRHGAQTLAAASHHAAFNTANALGPWLGGMAISAGFGWTSTGWVGASTAVAGLAIYAWAARTLSSRQPCPAL